MDNLSLHFLNPSEIIVSKAPCRIHTILGSCVAVCMWDQILKIGGMNHYMLPLWNGQGLASPKFGNIAIEKLVEKLLLMGSLKSNLVAKVFGGGEVIDTVSNHFFIGERNIDIAFEMLEHFKVPVVGSSTGGKLGRKIELNSLTGEVKLKLVQKTAPHAPNFQ